MNSESPKRFKNTVIAILMVLFVCVTAHAADYLPLQVGNRWVLRHPGTSKPVTIEVASKQGNTYRIHFSHPWGSNDWDLEPRGTKIYMVGYGQDGNVAPMGSDTVFFDFAASPGSTWKNSIGTLTVSKTNMLVKSREVNFPNCTQIKQVSGGASFFYAFSPGIGFTQFGDGKNAFILDTDASSLPGQNRAKPQEDDRPAQHVPGGNLASAPTPSRGKPAPRVRDTRPLNVGITTSIFANEASTPQNLLKRFDQTVDAGITFISAAQKWTEIESKPGKYNFEGLDFQISYATKLNVPMSVTLRIVDTVDRVVPSDVKRVAWDDPKMQQRVLGLIDAMAPHFKGHVKWFMFGNEIDGYFGRHPKEIPEFARLFSMVKAHVKQYSPETLVASTVMFGGIDTLNGGLSPLNEQYDFISITYYPIRGDFTMRPPDVVFQDFDRMRGVAAGRKVILQEIGYPSSSLNGSSQEKQAEFYKDVFSALRQNRDLVEAGNFFLLADLSDKFVKDLAGFYGMPNAKVFLSFLQTLGMFDLNGNPKKSWEVFTSEMKR